MSHELTPAFPSMNHVFVDFENVHDFNSGAIGEKSVSFTLFIGAKQTKMDMALVEKLIAHAKSVELIRLTSSGKNALDFTLAYHVGRTAVLDPGGYFHIISRDKGFDPLIEHLRSRNLRAYRHEDGATLTFSSTPKPRHSPATSSVNEKAHEPALFERACALLQKNPNNRPKTVKKLSSSLLASLGANICQPEIDTLIRQLLKQRLISISEKQSITYTQ